MSPQYFENHQILGALSERFPILLHIISLPLCFPSTWTQLHGLSQHINRSLFILNCCRSLSLDGPPAVDRELFPQGSVRAMRGAGDLLHIRAAVKHPTLCGVQ